MLTEKPGMFQTSTQALAFILAMVAMFLCVICALTADFLYSLGWFVGAALIFRGLGLGQFDDHTNE